MEKLLKPAEVAEILRVEVALARELMKTMPYINLTHSMEKPRLLVAEGDLEQWIQAQKHQPAGTASHARKAPARQGLAVLEGYDENGRLKRKKA